MSGRVTTRCSTRPLRNSLLSYNLASSFSLLPRHLEHGEGGNPCILTLKGVTSCVGVVADVTEMQLLRLKAAPALLSVPRALSR